MDFPARTRSHAILASSGSMVAAQVTGTPAPTTTLTTPPTMTTPTPTNDPKAGKSTSDDRGSTPSVPSTDGQCPGPPCSGYQPLNGDFKLNGKCIAEETKSVRVYCPEKESPNCCMSSSVEKSVANLTLHNVSTVLTCSGVIWKPISINCSTTTVPVKVTTAPTTSTTVPATSAPDASSSNTGAIVGSIVGVVALLAVVFFVMYQRKKKRAVRSPDFPDHQDSYLGIDSVDGAPKAAKASPPPPANSAATSTSTVVAEPKPRAHTESLLTQLSQRDDLKPLWMDIETLKTSAIKGGHNLFSCNVRGQKVALKGMDYPTASIELRADFIRSIHDVCKVQSPYITSISGVCLMNFQTRLCAVSEFMEKGALSAALLDATLVLSDDQKRIMALSLASGLAYLHESHKIVYGHLTSEKALVNARLECKLNVFELMKREYLDTRPCNTTFGAFEVPYQAPELRTVAPPPTTMATDVYALGVLIAEVFTRDRPCKALYAEKGLVAGDMYLYAHVETPAFDLGSLPSGVAQIVRQCWHINPAKRPTSSAVVAALK
ncbi:serine/threonine protein kinase [Saprolegnia diclina VS20]|uniref:Serine/threonine protein kinase n=1 Tax=Saprolegnia diclina (strain VS20) TaxID=1156394 RepID=T0Q271_SAPDV|nr:serine/threonine protein kinase [Saprolegnia diclina VS20]EQC31929.1 serine/threonine protein kinase [Saprolegnia diclina VS20]|eukprot:XP_008614657.1 serine/threonine protein kinase [Saprolegnia diclina VS20]